MNTLNWRKPSNIEPLKALWQESLPIKSKKKVQRLSACAPFFMTLRLKLRRASSLR
jgi:hypothetical protein